MVLLNGYTLISVCAVSLLVLVRTYRALRGHCTCSSLTVDCTGQNLSTIPSYIPNNIENLIFHKNNLTELQTRQFDHFKDLVKLDLSANQIRKIYNGAFQGLLKLQHLYLDGNHLPYDHVTYTDSLFKPLHNLKLLRINASKPGSSPVYPDNSLQHLNSLEILFMDGLYDKSLGAGFAKMKNLKNILFNGKKGHCNISSIYKDTIQHLKSLESIYLNDCDLSYIDPRSFANMENITTLDVSHNECLGIDGVTNATEGLSSSRFQKLYANRVVVNFPLCVIVPKRFACNLQNTSLRELQLNENKILAFGDKALECLPETLINASIRDNILAMAPYIIGVSSLSGLQELDLSGRYSGNVHSIPAGKSKIFTRCPKSKNVETDLSDEPYVLPYSFEVSFTNLGTPGYTNYGIPSNLTKLKYSNAQIYLHLTELHVTSNSITSIDLSDNMITRWKGPVYCFDKLGRLDLSNNRAGYVDQGFFDHLPNLLFLNLSYNYIGKSISNDKDGRIFKTLSKLQTLDLTENLIRELHSEIFSGLTSLKMLHIARNSIHSFSFDVYHMGNLQLMDLTSNQIRCVRWSARNQMNAIAERHKLEMDLSDNPLDCTCTCLYFLSWLIATEVKLGNLSNYQCVYDNGYVHHFTDKDDIRDQYLNIDTSCHYFSLAIGSTTAVIASLTLMFIGVVYRYRWKLRYWYFAAKHRYHQSSSYHTFPEFTFDAFVSYADGDRNFIVNELVSKLEQEGDLILNIHQRDFTPGRSIAENIIEAVQKIRRTLCILSRDFLESYWCIYELQMANMESVTTGRDVLLIVMMEEIPTRNIPAEIMYHIQTDSYIQYPAEGATDMFWRNLIHALKK